MTQRITVHTAQYLLKSALGVLFYAIRILMSIWQRLERPHTRLCIIFLILISSASLSGQTMVFSKSSSDPNPPVSAAFNYILDLTCSSSTAPCFNVVIRDTLPEVLNFLNFSDPLPAGVSSATYDDDTREAVIIFDRNLSPGTSVQMSIQVQFPNGSIDGSQAVNTAYATSRNAGNFESTATATLQGGRTPGIFPADKDGDRVQVTGGYQFWAVSIGNIGFNTIDNYTIVDTIPSGLVLDQMRTPEFPGLDHMGSLSYQRSDMPGVWLLWTDFNLNNRIRIDVSDLGLPAGVTIPMVRMNLNSVPGGGLYNPYIYPDLFDSRWSIYAIEQGTFMEGETFTNCAYYSGFQGGAISDFDCHSTTIGEPLNIVGGNIDAIDDLGNAEFTFPIGDTMGIALEFFHPSNAGFDITGGVMSAILPPNVSYVPDSWYYVFGEDNADFQIPVIQTETLLDGRELVRFVYDSIYNNSFTIESMNVWAGFRIEFSTFIEPGASEGSFDIEYYYNSVHSVHDNCNIVDEDNYLNGHSDSTCREVHNVNFIMPPGSAGLISSMEVFGTLDTDYSSYPDQGVTVPGGLSDYRINIKNPNATAINRLVFITVLPHVGDTEILDENTPRFSEWSPSLAAPISSLPPGLSVEYSTVVDPCRNELAGINPTPFPLGCNDPLWSSTPPSDITDVTALKFDYGNNVLVQNDSLIVDFFMRSPVDGVPDTSIAWNSFAYSARNLDDNVDLLPAEPVKVGIELRPGNVPIVGDFVWEDTEPNGRQDVGELGIDGVRVELYHDVDNDGIPEPGGPDTLELWTTTASGGQYLFSDFEYGRYFIVFSNLPTGFEPTFQDLVVDSLDSDGLVSEVMVFDNSTIDHTIDLGLYNGILPPLVTCDSGLLSNEEFESNFSSWTDNGNTSITSDSYSGARALLISGGVGGRHQAISVMPGETYKAGFFAKRDGLERTSGGLIFRDVSGNIVLDASRDVYENIYEYHSITATAPPAAVTVEVYGSKSAGPGLAYFDSFCLELIDNICDVGTDGDGDGIYNQCDIDDDNDGIRDNDEYICRGGFRRLIWWSHNTSTDPRGPEVISPDLVTSAVQENYGSGISTAISSTVLTMSGVDQPDLASAITDQDYVEYSLTTEANINAMFITRFSFTKTGFLNSATTDNYGYDFTIAVSDDGFATSELISTIFSVDLNTNPSFVTQRQEADNNFYLLRPSTTYTFRVYFYNKVTDVDTDTWYDDFAIDVELCNIIADIDSDGVVNQEDLDSDNDGLYDLYEAGHNEADNDDDGIIDDAQTSSGTNGFLDVLETLPDNGRRSYSISDSEVLPDIIYDAYELDSDDDGCFDAREESVPDANTDGIVGASTPSVDGRGLVIGYAYGPPPNNLWQDANLIKCVDISGVVFEDINYGGGLGRDYNSADLSAQSSSWNPDDIALNNVVLELYNAGGTYLESTTTDASGQYTFVDAGTGSFTVRMVNNSITSNRLSNGTSQLAIPVQTYRHDGVSSFTSEIGGRDPNKSDAPINSTDSHITMLTTPTTTTQSVSAISVGTTDINGVEFGVNFDLIVNTNDNGQGSLRQFIINSNELDNTNLDQEDNPVGGVSFDKPRDWETSIFMISGVGMHTITFGSTYPVITDDFTHISAYTQDGSVQGDVMSRNINVELSSATDLNDALSINADYITISGLSINNSRSGIVGSISHNNIFIWGNYIGTRPDGITARGNSSFGINLQNFTDSFIGTNGDGIDDLSEGNLVSDNDQGIQLRNSNNIWISGNTIGLDKNGTAPLGNTFNGVIIRDAIGRNIVGYNGVLASQSAVFYRNVIAANGNDAVRISNSDDQIVAGNFLGTDISGSQDRGNRNFGIQLQGSSSNNLIGTDADGDDDVLERNIISANGGGIRMQVGGTGTNNNIAGNYIGTDVSGIIALGNSANGIDISGPFSNNIIGTNGDGINDEIESNVISGNRGDGIRLFNTNNNKIAGNQIGVGADGATNLGNIMRGIFIAGTSASNIIGYSPAMTNSDELVVGNFIKNNDDAGIGISGSGSFNRISRNQIENNLDLGIDLGYDNVTSNDNGDVDSGANDLLNFPVFTTVSLLNDILTIRGFAPANTNIEVFVADAGPSPNPLPVSYSSSFGEGALYLFEVIEGGAADQNNSIGLYNNDGTGSIINRTQSQFHFDVDVSGYSLSEGMFITATATDRNDSTSEFSGVFQIIANCGTAIMNPHVMYNRSRSN